MEERGSRRRGSSRRHGQQPVKTIAVMGPTGSGKTSFINLASGSQLPVGDGHTSCTSAIGHSQVFKVKDIPIALVDTPGFDSNVKSAAEVLDTISAYLATSLEQGLYVSGIIYMRRITDEGMPGGTLMDFRLFRELCGEKALKNVLVVTNMWGLIDPDVGLAREEGLRTDEALFKPWFDAGAGLMHHDNTVESTHRIIWDILRHRPRLLRIQRELVTDKLTLDKTSAFDALGRQLHHEKMEHEKELKVIAEQHDKAVQEQDEATQAELEHRRQEVENRIRGLTADRSRKGQGFEAEKQRARDMGAVLLEDAKRHRGPTNQSPPAQNGHAPESSDHGHNDSDGVAPLMVPPPRPGGSRRSKREKRSSRDGHSQQGSAHESSTGAEPVSQAVHTRSISAPYPSAGTPKGSHRRVASVNPSALNGPRGEPKAVDYARSGHPAAPSSQGHGSVRERSVLSYEPAPSAIQEDPLPQIHVKQASVLSRQSVASPPRINSQAMMTPPLSPVASKALRDEIGRLTFELGTAKQLLDTSHRRVQDLEEAVARLTAELNTSGGSLHVLLQEALTVLMLNLMELHEHEPLPKPLRHRYWLRIPTEGATKQLLRPNWDEPFNGKKKWYKPWAGKPSWPKTVITKFRDEAPYLANNNTTLALFRTLTDIDIRRDLEIVYAGFQSRWLDESHQAPTESQYDEHDHEREHEHEHEREHERDLSHDQDLSGELYYSEGSPPHSPSMSHHQPNGHTH